MSSLWQELYGQPSSTLMTTEITRPQVVTTSVDTATITGNNQQTGNNALTNLLYVVFLIFLVAVASLIGYYLWKKHKEDAAAKAALAGSTTGSTTPNSATVVSSALGSVPPAGMNPYYPPVASTVSTINSQHMEYPQDPGNSNSDAAWWHNVDMYDQISQTAVSPYGGWWPAAPEVAGLSRGDYYRGYGWWTPGPYNSGYLTYPSNFIPTSTSQISVTDLHPFCSKQR